MAQDLNVARCVLSAVLAGCLLWCAPTWAAEPLPDPTRPPAHILDPSLPAEGRAGGSPLQSIKQSGRVRHALINGELVKVGSKVGEAVVDGIEATEVRLRHPDGRIEILKLYPEVALKPVQKPATRAKPKTGAREQAK